MDSLCELKQALISKAYEHINDLDNVNAKELGMVIDMIKDIELAKYYAEVREAMENSTSEEIVKHVDLASTAITK